MEIITTEITLGKLKEMANAMFGNMVKAVIDVDRESVAIFAELHSDLEALLLGNGSKQKDLWGINLYPDMSGDKFIEFDSLINIRPSSGNRSRGVDNREIRDKITAVVNKRVKR